jgi:hypothetical protein
MDELFFVNFPGVEDGSFANRQLSALHIIALEKAAFVSGMAGAVGLLYFKEKTVFVAVGIPADDILRVSA